MSVLIFSSETDLHAHAISWGLKQSGISTTFLDYTKFPINCLMSLFPQLDVNHISIKSRNLASQQLDLENIKLIWCRRMITANSLEFDGVHTDDRDHVKFECNEFIRNLIYSIEFMTRENKVKWVNSLQSARVIESKANQLLIAQLVGLQTPDTLISNDPANIRAFFRKNCGNVVMKAFNPSTWEENGTKIHHSTFALREEHLNDEALHFCPSIYQKNIKKKFELRVVCFDGLMIAARLNSQECEHTRQDWRHDASSKTMEIEPFTLKESVVEKLRRFMSIANLSFGSIDLIVDERDEVIFLEVNEQGQFLFLERQCPELNILNAIVDRFSKLLCLDSNTKNQITYENYLKSESHKLFLEMNRN